MNLEDINIYWVMIGLSLTIILSYIFNYISKLTRIPSVILLIITGFIVSFFIPLEMNLLRPFLQFLGAVGLIMIVLEAAFDLNLHREKAGTVTKALISSLVLLIVGALAIGWLISFFFEVSLIQALFYSIPLSIMSSAIIIPSVSHLGEDRKEFLIYEASFSDILGIMFFYFLEDSLAISGVAEVAIHVSTNILVTLVVAVILGYFVILVIERVRAQVKLFLPIAILILLYSIGKMFHLSSLIFILVFGLMINNREMFFKGRLKRMIDKDHFSETFQDLKILTLETSFIVRTFFFIIFGMTITADRINDPNIYVIGLGALIILMATRIGMVAPMLGKSKNPAIFVAPRGLITILLFFAIPTSQIIPEFNPAILLIVILGSNLIMTYGLMKYSPDVPSDEAHEEGEKVDLEITDSSSPKVQDDEGLSEMDRPTDQPPPNSL